MWWAELPEPFASEPGCRRPVLIVQSDAFDRSRIRTVVAAVVTGNLRLADAPGNVFMEARETGLPRASVVNVLQVVTLDKSSLSERAGRVGERAMLAVEDGLRTVLDL